MGGIDERQRFNCCRLHEVQKAANHQRRFAAGIDESKWHIGFPDMP